MKLVALCALACACNASKPAGDNPAPRTAPGTAAGTAAGNTQPALCRITAPYYLHLRTVDMKLSGTAWAQDAVASAVKVKNIAPRDRAKTIFDILGLSADALKADPDGIKAVFRSTPAKAPNATLEASYEEVWLAWDDHGDMTLRKVQIRPNVKSPWAMVDERAASAANGLDEYLRPHADVDIEVTVEHGKRTYLDAEQLEKCGGVFACQKQAYGTTSKHSFGYRYSLDWSKKEKIEAAGRASTRSDSTLGFGHEDSMAGHRFVFDDLHLTNRIALYLTLQPDPVKKSGLEQVLATGKPEQRNGVPCLRGPMGNADVCFSREQCLTTYFGFVEDLSRSTPPLNSIEYAEVLETSNQPFDPALFKPSAGGVTGMEDPSRIRAYVPDVLDIYARYRQAMAVAAAGDAIRPTLYGDDGDPKPSQPPTSSDDCKTWGMEGQRRLCTLFGMDRTKQFATTYKTATVAELDDDDKLVVDMFGGSELAFFKKAFSDIEPLHWRFVLVLERVRREMVATLGKGNPGKNLFEWVGDRTDKLSWLGICKDTRCNKREDTLATTVERGFDRASWQRFTMISKMENEHDSKLKKLGATFTFRYEHTAGCYVLPGTPPVELAVDAWRNTFTSARDWWQANDTKDYDALTTTCGGVYCGECACLRESYKFVHMRADWTPAQLAQAYAGLCPNIATSFEHADQTYGAAVRKSLAE